MEEKCYEAEFMTWMWDALMDNKCSHYILVPVLLIFFNDIFFGLKCCVISKP